MGWKVQFGDVFIIDVAILDSIVAE